MRKLDIAMIAAIATVGTTSGGVPVMAQQIQFAAPTPGVCLLGRNAALGQSRVGQAATARMTQLANGITAELDPQRKALQRDAEALNAAQKTLAPAEFQQRATALRQRDQALVQLTNQRAQQLQRTKATVEGRITQAMAPLLATIVPQRRCSVILERSASYGWNPAMDITAEIVAGLDRTLPSIQFDLAA